MDAISPDGLTRTRITTIPEEYSDCPQLLWCDGKALYGFCSLGGSKFDMDSVLLRIDLTTGAIASLPLAKQEELVGAMGKEFVTCQIITEEPLPEEYDEVYKAILQNATIRYSLVDFATGAHRTVAERPYDRSFYTVWVCGRELICRDFISSEAQENGKPTRLQAVDVDTGAERTVLEMLPNGLGFQQIKAFYAVGSHRPDNWFLSYEERSKGSYMTVNSSLFDLEDGSWTELDRHYQRGGDSIPAKPMAQTADGRWLVQVGVAPQSSMRRCYAILDPAAFLSGSTDCQLVSCTQAK